MRSLLFLFISTCFLACSDIGKNESETQQSKNSTTEKESPKDGPHKEFYPNGNIKLLGKYKNGQRSGLWASWYESGELQSELTYFQGKETGKYRVYHKNGNLKLAGEYQNGEMLGEWKYFDESGEVIATKDYSP